MTGPGHGRSGPVGPPTGEAYERDQGLAAERTELAWGRSTLALLACAVAMAKGLPKVTGNVGHPIAGAVIIVMSGIVWLLGLPYARARAQATRTGTRHRATPRELAPLAIGTAGLGVAALVIDLFLPH